MLQVNNISRHIVRDFHIPHDFTLTIELVTDIADDNRALTLHSISMMWDENCGALEFGKCIRGVSESVS